jgi:hypothetical protein
MHVPNEWTALVLQAGRQEMAKALSHADNSSINDCPQEVGHLQVRHDAFLTQETINKPKSRSSKSEQLL